MLAKYRCLLCLHVCRNANATNHDPSFFTQLQICDTYLTCPTYEPSFIKLQSTLVISNSKELSEILRNIRTSTYHICRIEKKLKRLTTFNKYMCNWTLEVRDILKILWKRGEIAT